MVKVIDSIPHIIKQILINLTWINILLSMGIVFIERKDPTSTLLWIMVVNFLPGFGFLAYLYLGKNVRKSRMFRIKEIAERTPNTNLLEQRSLMDSDSLVYKEPWIKTYQGLIKMNLVSAKSVFTDNNKVDVFFDGQELFNQLVEDIENAKISIDIEYYIFKTDEVGVAILEVVEEKAKEGIPVRLLMDGMGGRFFSKEWKDRLEKVGVHIATFFPPSLPLVNIRLNYRNHRKIVVIDGEIGYVGGFNVGNEYLSLSKRFGYWRDTHIRMTGDGVNALWRRFYHDFAFAENYRGNIDMPNFEKEQPTLGNVGMNIVTSGPDSKWPSIRNAYAEMIHMAKKRVYIQTPYFIPDNGIMNSLKLAALTGVDVRMMIPNKPDHPFVYWATLSHAGELLEAGVKLYTYQRGFLHSKMVLVDDTLSSVGTANMDVRSFRLNFEVNTFMYDREINGIIAEQYHEDLKYCHEITLDEYRKRSKWIVVKESVSRLFSPIL